MIWPAKYEEHSQPGSLKTIVWSSWQRRCRCYRHYDDDQYNQVHCWRYRVLVTNQTKNQVGYARGAATSWCCVATLNGTSQLILISCVHGVPLLICSFLQFFRWQFVCRWEKKPEAKAGLSRRGWRRGLPRQTAIPVARKRRKTSSSSGDSTSSISLCQMRTSARAVCGLSRVQRDSTTDMYKMSNEIWGN